MIQDTSPRPVHSAQQLSGANSEQTARGYSPSQPFIGSHATLPPPLTPKKTSSRLDTSWPLCLRFFGLHRRKQFTCPSIQSQPSTSSQKWIYFSRQIKHAKAFALTNQERPYYASTRQPYTFTISVTSSIIFKPKLFSRQRVIDSSVTPPR